MEFANLHRMFSAIANSSVLAGVNEQIELMDTKQLVALREEAFNLTDYITDIMEVQHLVESAPRGWESVDTSVEDDFAMFEPYDRDFGIEG
jgi:hypothetical protein